MAIANITDIENYTEQEQAIIEEHIERHFGHYAAVMKEIAPDNVNVDILLIPPNEENNFYSLVTLGFGAHVMDVPEDMKGNFLERAEFVLSLPPDWKPDMNIKNSLWPIALMKLLTRFAIDEQTYFADGHTLQFPAGLFPDPKFSAVMVYKVPFGKEAAYCAFNESYGVNFYQLDVLMEAELEYKVKFGAEALEFNIGNIISPVIDLKRDSYIKYREYNVMDRADYHQGIETNDLPLDPICKYNHMAIFMEWCIEKNLLSESFKKDYALQLKMFSEGKTDLRYFIRDCLNGVIIREFLSLKGDSFASYYYNYDRFEEDNSNPFYPKDVDDYALSYFGKEKYYSKEFADEAYLFVPYDEKYKKEMKDIIASEYWAYFLGE